MRAGILPICFNCARFQQIAAGTGFVCEAFANGIPVDILASVKDHHNPYPGDNGLQFMPKLAQDSVWHEEDHPRGGNPDNPGEFSKGSGGSGSGSININTGEEVKEKLSSIEHEYLYSWIKYNDRKLAKSDDFDALLKKFPQKKGTFFRGISVKKGTYFKIGQTINFNEAVSSTPSLSKSKNFAQWSKYKDYYALQRLDPPKIEETSLNNELVIFKFENTEGYSLTPAEEYISKNSRFGGGFKSEKEVVIPKQAKFVVTNITEEDVKAYAKYQENSKARIVTLSPIKEPGSLEKLNKDSQITIDPPVSEAQRKAMWAAASGHSNIGIPESVGKEFAEADPGGKLPNKAKDKITKDMDKEEFGLLRRLLNKFFGEEEEEPEHEGQDAFDSEGAGVIYHTKDGKVLFIKRSSAVDHSGEWSFPGGTVEDDENSEQAAIREAQEELGKQVPSDNIKLVHSIVSKDGVKYYTFHREVDDAFDPDLNKESSAFVWRDLRSAPSPLHPGAKQTLDAIIQNKTYDFGKAKDEWSEEARKAALEARRSHAKSYGWKSLKSSPTRAGIMHHENFPEHSLTIPSHSETWSHYGPVKGATGHLHLNSGNTSESLQAHLKNFHSGKFRPGAKDEETEEGKLSSTTRKEIGTVGSEKREDMPESVFLEPSSRKYPVKEKRDGEWKYTRNLLLAAARRARMEHNESLASKADKIRAREFDAGEDILKYKDAFDESFKKLEKSLAHKKGVTNAPALAAWIGRKNGKIPAADERLALDRSSNRVYDADGRMHVKDSNISKATVNPYYGKEIPNYAELGLDPEKKYMLLRHPEELAKAIDTFNNIPILNRHVPTSATDYDPELVIGSTGTDARFEPPYLKNSLVFWPQSAIDNIEDDKIRQLSCAYRYDPEMTSGEYEGQHYDGIMRNIIGNHVALVKEGRAGPDVLVSDAKPLKLKLEEKEMSILTQLIGRSSVKSALRGMNKTDPDVRRFLGALDDLEGNSSLPVTEKDVEQEAGEDSAFDEDYEDMEEEEREAQDARDRRGADARRRLGRDESEEEKEEREKEERAQDARDRLGRDESEEEREEREEEEKEAQDARDMMKRARDARKHADDARRHARDAYRMCRDRRRAADARRRLGRDESEEEKDKREEEEKAQDRKRAEDRRGRREADDRKRAEDKRREEADDSRRRAEDNPPLFKGMPKTGAKDGVDRKAMDAAIAQVKRDNEVAIAKAIENTKREQNAVHDAERFVRKWVGDLNIAFDSANEVYATALHTLGVNTKNMHPDAFKAVLEAQPLPGQQNKTKYAVDAAFHNANDFTEQFPAAGRIKIMH